MTIIYMVQRTTECKLTWSPHSDFEYVNWKNCRPFFIKNNAITWNKKRKSPIKSKLPYLKLSTWISLQSGVEIAFLIWKVHFFQLYEFGRKTNYRFPIKKCAYRKQLPYRLIIISQSNKFHTSAYNENSIALEKNIWESMAIYQDAKTNT